MKISLSPNNLRGGMEDWSTPPPPFPRLPFRVFLSESPFPSLLFPRQYGRVRASLFRVFFRVRDAEGSTEGTEKRHPETTRKRFGKDSERDAEKTRI